MTCSQASGRREVRSQILSSTHGQPLAAFRAAPLEHDTPILGVHADEETMGAPAVAAIRLKGTLHVDSKLGRSRPWRNHDPNERVNRGQRR